MSNATVAVFGTTNWSLVLTAGDSESPKQNEALEQLCARYWHPLYAYVRQHGFSRHESEDLIQEFFSRVLEREFLSDVGPEKGRFRTFLLVCLKRFLAVQWHHDHAQKRGGNCLTFSINFEKVESQIQGDLADNQTPERVFIKRWALALLNHVIVLLTEEMEKSGKGRLFSHIKVFLVGDKRKVPYRELAAELEVSEGSLKVAVHRMRKRYQQLLRNEISRTVTHPDQVDEEIRDIFSAISS